MNDDAVRAFIGQYIRVIRMAAALKSGESDYGLAVRRAVLALWNGTLDKGGFNRQLEDTIDLGLRRAWDAGLRDVGVREMTGEQLTRINEIVIDQWKHVEGFADWIIENDKAHGGKLGDLQPRASLWYDRYNSVRYEARLYGPQEERYIWRLGPTERHCQHNEKPGGWGCANLAGVVATAAEWRAAGIRPMSSDLSCNGFQCQCSLDKTDEPLTEGGIPAP